jgi:hypothetical protein
MRRALVIVLFAIGCRAKAEGPSCASVAGRYYAIARDALATAKPPDELRRDVADQLPAMRDALAAACEDGEWSAAVRDCMVRAADHPALQTCERDLTEAQQRGLDRAARGEP